jgi:hypothetical protein
MFATAAVCKQNMSGRLLPAPRALNGECGAGFPRNTPPRTAAGAVTTDNLCLYTGSPVLEGIGNDFYLSAIFLTTNMMEV